MPKVSFVLAGGSFVVDIPNLERLKGKSWQLSEDCSKLRDSRDLDLDLDLDGKTVFAVNPDSESRIAGFSGGIVEVESRKCGTVSSVD